MDGNLPMGGKSKFPEALPDSKSGASGVATQAQQSLSIEEYQAAYDNFLKLRMEEATRLAKQDMGNWLVAQGYLEKGVAFENSGENTSIYMAGENKGAEERFVFRKYGPIWKVIFKGMAEFHLNDSLGTQYINYLLHNPNVPISAVDLEQKIRPEKAGIRAKTSIQYHLDDKTIKAYLKEVEKLRAQRTEANDEGRFVEAERLDHEIAQIESEFHKNGNIGDTGERARGNVRKAIDAICRKLKIGDKSEKAFEQHIRDNVSLGYTILYTNPDGKIWG